MHQKGRTGECRSGSNSGESDVILIPKHLRIEWTDVVMLDPGLSPIAKAAAGVIGHHFNRKTGDTFLAQKTIAAVLGITVRALQKAIEVLERRGYLIIKRRLLKVREIDGKRFFGGRGIANIYLPAFCGEQISKAMSGRLLERIEDCWERAAERLCNKKQMNEPAFVRSEHNERISVRPFSNESTNGETRKNEPGFVPTLSNPTDCNPGPEGASVSAVSLAYLPTGIADLLRVRFDEATFDGWLAGLAISEILPGKDYRELVLTAPSQFSAELVQMEYASAICECYNAVMPPEAQVRRVLIKSRT
jgi:hypothetical protein